MKTIHFDPREAVPVYLEGRGGRHTQLDMVLDTGSSMTLISPTILDGVGYNPREGERMTMIRTPRGRNRDTRFGWWVWKCLDIR